MDIPLSDFMEIIPNKSSFFLDHVLLITQMFDNKVKAFLKWLLPQIGIVQYAYTGCPTSILPFSKAYFTKTKAVRSKIPTVLGVS